MACSICPIASERRQAPLQSFVRSCLPPRFHSMSAVPTISPSPPAPGADEHGQDRRTDWLPRRHSPSVWIGLGRRPRHPTSRTANVTTFYPLPSSRSTACSCRPSGNRAVVCPKGQLGRCFLRGSSAEGQTHRNKIDRKHVDFPDLRSKHDACQSGASNWTTPVMDAGSAAARTNLWTGVQGGRDCRCCGFGPGGLQRECVVVAGGSLPRSDTSPRPAASQPLPGTGPRPARSAVCRWCCGRHPRGSRPGSSFTECRNYPRCREVVWRLRRDGSLRCRKLATLPPRKMTSECSRSAKCTRNRRSWRRN